jgi:hypothetical protein
MAGEFDTPQAIDRPERDEIDNLPRFHPERDCTETGGM